MAKPQTVEWTVMQIPNHQTVCLKLTLCSVQQCNLYESHMITAVVWITNDECKEIFMTENANSIRKFDENVNEDK